MCSRMWTIPISSCVGSDEYTPLYNISSFQEREKVRENCPEPSDGAAHEGTVDGTKPEELNKKALQIIQRVRDKLTGGMRQGGGEGRGGKEKGDLDVAIVNCPHHMTCFLFLR